MSKQGIRIVDLRHTLPNLKYLLTVLTSGKGELPRRKGGRSEAQSDHCGTNEERNLSGDDWRIGNGDGGLAKLMMNGKKPASRIQSPLGREIGHLINRV